MKSPKEIFKNKLELLEEPEVEELLKYCEELEEQVIDFKFEKEKNKELAMKDMLQEVIKGCQYLEKEQMEHERFGCNEPRYQECILNLKRYILNRCRDEKIYL